MSFKAVVREAYELFVSVYGVHAGDAAVTNVKVRKGEKDRDRKIVFN